MSATLDYPQKHPISAEEYLRMSKGGVFAPEARLELIEGEIVEMTPIEPPHAGLVKQLNQLFGRRTGGKALVSVQDPLIISDHSVPQPDLALLKPRVDFYRNSHPGVDDVYLVVEVADTTIAFDLRVKVPLYARCGIAEAWVIDVNEQVIHVFREPGTGGYRTTLTVSSGQHLACVALPEAFLEAGELFSS